MNEEPSPALGILGGTFDPPHIGHLLLAETAHHQLNLERVLFIPTGEPPHKSTQPLSPAAIRLQMTELAVADNEAFTVSRLDMKRDPPHYTATLLPLLRQRYGDAKLWLLIGGDSLRDLPTWYEPRTVVEQSRLAVLPRPGAPFHWEMLEQALPDLRARVTILDGPHIALSSTRIRTWAAQGRSLRYVVPPAVARLIEHEQLYQRP
ncbi:MAG: nicotinate-nucleotide adenylyltransferase [Candidatus Promineifilaceae bacterium]|nr:nicotinate-nucleotide adenylyltransferase [Candidatus Promineifilaceae bacterium]